MNLRGTIKKWNAPMGRQLPIDYKLRQLQRQINKQKPAIENHRASWTHSIASGFNKDSNAITTDFTGSPDFRKTIIGDRFTNLYLKHTHVFPSTCIDARVLVYATRRTGVTFNPALTAAGYATIPDPAFVRVLSDNYITFTQSRGKTVKLFTPLKNIQTVYNESSDTLENGEIYMMVMTQGNSVGSVVYSSSQLHVRNK